MKHSNEYLTERETWIDVFGSTHLKRLRFEGIEYDATYRDERLNRAAPGWQYASRIPGKALEARNVPDEALSLLTQAREAGIPDAHLVYWKAEFREIVETRFSQQQGGKYWTGYCAEAEFLGRKIVFGLPFRAKARKYMKA